MDIEWMDVDLDEIKYYCIKNFLLIPLVARCLNWYTFMINPKGEADSLVI